MVVPEKVAASAIAERLPADLKSRSPRMVEIPVPESPKSVTSIVSAASEAVNSKTKIVQPYHGRAEYDLLIVAAVMLVHFVFWLIYLSWCVDHAYPSSPK